MPFLIICVFVSLLNDLVIGDCLVSLVRTLAVGVMVGVMVVLYQFGDFTTFMIVIDGLKSFALASAFLGQQMDICNREELTEGGLVAQSPSNT